MASQPPPSQDTVPRPQIKQPPPKREKMQCLFCTKPARLTCHHKLCKKCCNERHPNDCKAHESGPVSDKDKPKPARLQAPQPAQPHAAYSLLPDAKSAPQRVESSHRGGASDHHALRAVPPGPHTTNLTEAVQAHHKEAQESARWQARAHSQSQQQQHEEAQEALQHYTGAAQLLGQLFQGSLPSAEAHPDHEPLRLQGDIEIEEPAPNRVCQEDNNEVHTEGTLGLDNRLAAEHGLEEPAAPVKGELYNKLTSLQAALGLPSNRTSIVL